MLHSLILYEPIASSAQDRFFSISLTFTLTPPLGTVSQGQMKSGSAVQKKQPLWNPERRQHCSPCSLSLSKCGTNEITAETMQRKGDPTDREGKDNEPSGTVNKPG